MNSDFIVAVHALVYLNHKADIVSSEALAKNICTNAARVRKVMAPLKRAGLVTTREGNVGGYRKTPGGKAAGGATVLQGTLRRSTCTWWPMRSTSDLCNPVGIAAIWT